MSQRELRSRKRSEIKPYDKQPEKVVSGTGGKKLHKKVTRKIVRDVMLALFKEYLLFLVFDDHQAPHFAEFCLRQKYFPAFDNILFVDANGKHPNDRYEISGKTMSDIIESGSYDNLLICCSGFWLDFPTTYIPESGPDEFGKSSRETTLMLLGFLKQNPTVCMRRLCITLSLRYSNYKNIDIDGQDGSEFDEDCLLMYQSSSTILPVGFRPLSTSKLDDYYEKDAKKHNPKAYQMKRTTLLATLFRFSRDLHFSGFEVSDDIVKNMFIYPAEKKRTAMLFLHVELIPRDYNASEVIYID